MVQHVVQVGYLSRFVTDDGEFERRVGDFIDVFNPVVMVLDVICREANQLDTSFRELGLQFGKRSQLGRADRGEVFRM